MDELRTMEKMVEKYPALLPDSVREMADHLGLRNTLLIVKRLGGASHDIPKGDTSIGRVRERWLKEILGDEAAEALVYHYGGCDGVYIPKCQVLFSAIQDVAMQERFDELSGEGLSARSIVPMLVVEFGLSDKTVWKALKRDPADRLAAKTPHKKEQAFRINKASKAVCRT
jgi:Mor family transcriptional regulator